MASINVVHLCISLYKSFESYEAVTSQVLRHQLHEAIPFTDDVLISTFLIVTPKNLL